MKWTYVWASLALVAGCTSTDAPAASAEDAVAADTADVAEEPEGSFYDFAVVLPSGLQQRFQGDIDVTQVAFGSSHIAPAVSLAVEVTYPKPFATFTFNLGFVVGSNSYEVTIDDVGEWTFGSGQQNAPPGFKITMKDSKGIQRVFASWPEGASGKYRIFEWGIEPGEVVAGEIEGTLVNAQGDPLEATVIGEFRIVLPERDGGR